MNVFITGVSSGVGRALAKELVSEGHRVWGVARRHELLESLRAEIASGNFFFSVCDISRHDDIRRVYAEMGERGFSPDVVVLNAAILESDMLPHFSIEAFDRVMRINVRGALAWVDAFIEDFFRKDSGQFIAISSVAAFRPDPLRIAYPASKAALALAFRGLWERYRKSNISFTTIFFGPVATEMSAHVRHDAAGRIVGKSFLVASPEDAARRIIRAMREKKSRYFFPFWGTLLFRATRFLPDRAFVWLSKKFKKIYL